MPRPLCNKQPNGQTNYAIACTKELMHKGRCSWDRGLGRPFGPPTEGDDSPSVARAAERAWKAYHRSFDDVEPGGAFENLPQRERWAWMSAARAARA